MKVIKSGADRSVRSEQIPGSCNVQGDIERLLVVLHVRAGALKRGKRRMALIEMTYLGPQAYRSEQTPATDPKNDLLFEAHLCVATIKFARYAAVSRRVRKVVGVEQVQLCSPNGNLPTTKPNLTIRQSDLQP